MEREDIQGLLMETYQNQVHCMLKLYIFDTELLEVCALYNGMSSEDSSPSILT